MLKLGETYTNKFIDLIQININGMFLEIHDLLDQEILTKQINVMNVFSCCKMSNIALKVELISKNIPLLFDISGSFHNYITLLQNINHNKI